MSISLLLIIILLVVLFGGINRGWAPQYNGGIGLVVLILVILLLLGRI